jgi:aromatic-L-amino-acid decarboxylase
MGVNFDCTFFWTSDRAAVLGALSILPEYLRSAAAESGAAIDYRDWQVPLGRRFRALKVWMTLRLDGVEPVCAMIRHHVEMTQRLAELVAQDVRFEIVAPHPLNLLVVRLVGRDADARTDALIAAANATGEVLFTRTVLDGRVALRFSIGARATKWEHVDAGWRLVQSLADVRRRPEPGARPQDVTAAPMRVSRSTSMNAVAPQTVSSSSSKKCSSRSVGLRPQRSAW